MKKPLIPALALLVSALCLGCEALFNPYGLSGYLYLNVFRTEPNQYLMVWVDFRTLGENPVAVTGYALVMKDAKGAELPYAIDFPPTLRDDHFMRHREGISFGLEVRTLAADRRIPTKVKVTVYFKDERGHSASVTQSVDIPRQN